jgi:hypothetical protein
VLVIWPGRLIAFFVAGLCKETKEIGEYCAPLYFYNQLLFGNVKIVIVTGVIVNVV